MPSIENFTIHKLCFGGFVLISVVNMWLTYHLMQRSLQHSKSRSGEHKIQELLIKSLKSLVLKRRILKSNFIAIPALVYFYWRHNTYCEPYIYTMFCFVEYLIVLMNIVYHFSGYYLLFGMDVRIQSQELIGNSSSALNSSNEFVPNTSVCTV